MDQLIDKAIEAMLTQAAKPGVAPKPEDALKFSQAALNLAHVKAVLKPLETGSKPKGS